MNVMLLRGEGRVPMHCPLKQAVSAVTPRENGLGSLRSREQFRLQIDGLGRFRQVGKRASKTVDWIFS